MKQMPGKTTDNIAGIEEDWVINGEGMGVIDGFGGIVL